VDAGWAVVRDAVNMFFVIVLIAIAMGTIFGAKRFEWRQQVPRLLIMAVVINFSRTLCGLMIDFSQVIMLTFVNALKDIAGGNFVQMLGLRDILEANDASSLFGSNAEAGAQAFDIFIAGIIALLMMMIVFVALLFLVIILAYRIVLLWVLITIAPLAWFFKGAEGVVATKSNPYGKWWTRFSCALQLGPILTFFLWLSLAVAGAGNIGDQFPESNAPEGEGLNTGSLLKAMDTSRMTGFIIGILLLFAGFDAAKESCDGADGVMSGMMQKAKGMGTTIAKAPVGAAGVAAAWSGRQALRAGRAAGGAVYKQTVGRGLAAGRDFMADQLGKAGKSGGALGGVPMVGGYLSRTATEMSSTMKAKRAAETEASLKDKKPMTAEAMKNYFDAGVPIGAEGRKEYMARMRQALSSDEYRALVGPDGIAKLLGQKDGLTGKSSLEMLEKAFEGDAGFQKQMKDIKKRAPSAFGKEALEKYVSEAADIQAVDKDEFGSQAFRDHVKNLKYQRRKADGSIEEISMEKAITEGDLGNRVRGLWEKGATQLADRTSADALKGTPTGAVDVNLVNTTNYSPELAVKLVSEGNSAQMRALSARDDLKSRIRADKDKILAAALSGAKDQKGRLGVRNNLMAAGLSKEEAFDMKVGPTGAVSFIDDEAREDFKAAAADNANLVLDSTQDPKSELAGMAAGSMSTTSMTGLLKKFRNMKPVTKEQVAEKQKLKEQINKLFEAINERSTDIYTEHGGKPPPALRQEYARLQKLQSQREYFNRDAASFDLSEMELAEEGPAPAAPAPAAPRPAAPAPAAPAPTPIRPPASASEAQARIESLKRSREALQAQMREREKALGRASGEAAAKLETEMKNMERTIKTFEDQERELSKYTGG
jgi:hypothetical protein